MGLIKILRVLKFLKTVNVIYRDEQDETVFVDRVLTADLPRTGEVIIRSGRYWRVGTIWHDQDENIIEIDLTDL